MLYTGDVSALIYSGPLLGFGTAAPVTSRSRRVCVEYTESFAPTNLNPPQVSSVPVNDL